MATIFSSSFVFAPSMTPADSTDTLPCCTMKKSRPTSPSDTMTSSFAQKKGCMTDKRSVTKFLSASSKKDTFLIISLFTYMASSCRSGNDSCSSISPSPNTVLLHLYSAYSLILCWRFRLTLRWLRYCRRSCLRRLYSISCMFILAASVAIEPTMKAKREVPTHSVITAHICSTKCGPATISPNPTVVIVANEPYSANMYNMDACVAVKFSCSG
mmetsp:Transcript_47401/g.122630  ORF Transcript_47401/g.122630 Transcript_47401/m.122630 type:complete len:214 (-) Transcript_47401:1279-1920(-)